MPSPILRARVIATYKELLWLGRGYPTGYQRFRNSLHKAFVRNANLTDEAEIEKRLEYAEFVKKEIEAMYMLKKYRVLRHRYDPFT